MVSLSWAVVKGKECPRVSYPGESRQTEHYLNFVPSQGEAVRALPPWLVHEYTEKRINKT